MIDFNTAADAADAIRTVNTARANVLKAEGVVVRVVTDAPRVHVGRVTDVASEGVYLDNAALIGWRELCRIEAN